MFALGQKQIFRMQLSCPLYPPKADTGSALAHIARSAGATDKPRAFAVLKLMTSSYLVGARTGMLIGFLPLRTLDRRSWLAKNYSIAVGLEGTTKTSFAPYCIYRNKKSCNLG